MKDRSSFPLSFSLPPVLSQFLSHNPLIHRIFCLALAYVFFKMGNSNIHNTQHIQHTTSTRSHYLGSAAFDSKACSQSNNSSKLFSAPDKFGNWAVGEVDVVDVLRQREETRVFSLSVRSFSHNFFINSSICLSYSKKKKIRDCNFQ